MKGIIFDSEGTVAAVNHLVAYGYTEIIIFSRGITAIDVDYYRLNDINITVVEDFPQGKTEDKLLKIKGSLTEKFLIVYSGDICFFDLDESLKNHNQKQATATLIQKSAHMCAAICEREVFDYLTKENENFERELLLKIGQDGELNTLE